MFSDKEFLKRTWLIVLPVTVQQALDTLANLVDNIMVGRLGTIEIGAVGLASRIFFIIILAIFGIGSGMSVLAAQYWGNDDVVNIRKVVGLGTIVGFIFSFVCAAISVIMPKSVMGIFTDNEMLIECGATYLRIVAFSFPLIAVYSTITAGLRSMDIVKPIAYFTGIAIVVNIFFNWILIFGKFGCPALGVAGAAYATVLARVVALIVLIIYLKKSNSVLWCAIREYFGYNKVMVTQFKKMALTVTLNDLFWGLGNSFHSITYGRMGEAETATMSIITTFQDIEVVGLLGLATATAVIVGNELGAGHLEKAKQYSNWYMKLGLMAGGLVSIITILSIKPIISIYGISGEVAILTASTMSILALSLLWRADNNITIVGILRAGGDTTACALIDTLPLWLIAVPLVMYTGLYLHWPLWAVYLVQQSDEFIKLICSLIRVKSGKWVKNLNVELNNELC